MIQHLPRFLAILFLACCFQSAAGQATLLDDPHQQILLSMHPNPANETVEFQLQLHSESTVNIAIIDLAGVWVRSHTGTFTQGEKFVRMHIADLEEGVYFVKITSGAEQVTKRLIVRRQ